MHQNYLSSFKYVLALLLTLVTLLHRMGVLNTALGRKSNKSSLPTQRKSPSRDFTKTHCEFETQRLQETLSWHSLITAGRPADSNTKKNKKFPLDIFLTDKTLR